MKGNVDNAKVTASGYVAPVSEELVGEVSEVVDADIQETEKKRKFIDFGGFRWNVTVAKDSYKLYILKFNVEIGKAKAGTIILIAK